MSKPAFVFNPLRPTTLEFSGREYHFPKGVVSQVQDQRFWAPDEYRRHLDNGSPEDKEAVHEMIIPALRFAETLFGNRHYTNLRDAGFWVGDREPNDKEKQTSDAKAKAWKMKEIDLFIQERRERQSGGMGRLAPDQEVIDWMIELNVFDPLYNPAPTGTSNEELARLATAVGLGVVEAMESRSKQPEPARK